MKYASAAGDDYCQGKSLWMWTCYQTHIFIFFVGLHARGGVAISVGVLVETATVAWERRATSRCFR